MNSLPELPPAQRWAAGLDGPLPPVRGQAEPLKYHERKTALER